MINYTKNINNFFKIESSIDDLNISTIGKSCNTIDYSKDLIEFRQNEKDLISSITGISQKNIMFLNQVHKDNIIIISKDPGNDSKYVADADAMITNLPGICTVIRTADCVPVFIYDSETKALGAVHSGWKGTHLQISKKVAIEMNKSYGSQYKNMLVFILPSIGPRSYEVNMDVGQYFPEDLQSKDGKLYLDLWQNIERSLIDLGVQSKNIFNSKICTLECNEEFFSYRMKDNGRNLNFSYIKN